VWNCSAAPLWPPTHRLCVHSTAAPGPATPSTRGTGALGKVEMVEELHQRQVIRPELCGVVPHRKSRSEGRLRRFGAWWRGGRAKNSRGIAMGRSALDDPLHSTSTSSHDTAESRLPVRCYGAGQRSSRRAVATSPPAQTGGHSHLGMRGSVSSSASLHVHGGLGPDLCTRSATLIRHKAEAISPGECFSLLPHPPIPS
jgi:hypothetical protein